VALGGEGIGGEKCTPFWEKKGEGGKRARRSLHLNSPGHREKSRKLQTSREVGLL